MEDKIKVGRFQEVPAAEFMALQEFAQEQDDRIVHDLLFDRPAFTGLKAVKSAALEIEVAKGRLWKEGGSYPLRASVKLSVVSLLPTSNRRIVLLVASASTDENAEPDQVRFLTNVSPRQYEVRNAATRVERRMGIELVAGPASASPSRPAVPAGGLVVASFRVGSGGIVGDVEMEGENEATSQDELLARVFGLEGLYRKVRSQLVTFKTDLGGVARSLKSKADKSALREVQRGVVRIREAIDIPDTATTYGIDNFATASETDLALTTSIVEGGYVKFGAAERQSRLIALANPIEPKLDLSSSGLALPKATSEPRLEIDDPDGELAIANYATASVTLSSRPLTRSYLYYAGRAPYAEVEAKLREEPLVRLLDPRTDAYVDIDLSRADWELVSRKTDLLPGASPYWQIDVTKEVWAVGAVDTVVSGARAQQPFLCAQSGWHDRIDLLFTDVDSAGDVHLAVCETDGNGDADLSKVVARTTVAAADLKRAPEWTPFLFDPHFLSRGSIYAPVVITNGDHRLALSATNDGAQGALGVSVGGTSWDGQIDRDLCMRLYARRFANTRTLVDLEDVALAGGIRHLAAILTGHQPAGCELKLQAQIAGVWRTLGVADATILASAPTSARMRMVMLGTKDVAPGIDLSASRIVASRPLLSSVQVSTRCSLPPAATTTALRVVVDPVGFDPAIHTLSVAILHGAGYATQTNFTSVKNGKFGDHRIFTVGGLPNINEFKIKLTKTTTDPGRTFSVQETGWNAG